MKNRKVFTFILLTLLMPICSSCSGNSFDGNGEKRANYATTVSGVRFDNLPTLSGTDLANFIARPGTSPNWNNDPYDYGVINSEYYTVKNSGETISYPVYMANSTYGLQSFCYIKVNNFSSTSFKIYYASTITKVEIMHHSEGTKSPSYTKSGKCLNILFNETGHYTFILNGEKNKALSLFINESRTYEEFLSDYPGCTVNTLSPGTYNNVISITTPNTVYHLTKGTYYIRRFDLLADKIGIYMDDGVYIYGINPTREDEPDVRSEQTWAGQTQWKEFFNGYAGNDDGIEMIRYRGLTIEGNAIIDLSRLDWHARKGMQLNGTLDVTLKDFTIVNPPEWSFWLKNCQNAVVTNIKIYGYRQNSDGIAMDTCMDSTVSNCYARSGDDLFEIKGIYVNRGAASYHTENVTFTQCTAWPEKTRAYGVIAEVVNDIKDVYFKNCISIDTRTDIGTDSGNLLVYIESKVHCPATISNIHFENIRIYENATYPYNIKNDGDGGYVMKDIYFKNVEIFYDSASSYNNRLLITNSTDYENEIGNLYFDNIYINQALVTENNFVYTKTGNFDTSLLHINTL